jgi:hypothetical protein
MLQAFNKTKAIQEYIVIQMTDKNVKQIMESVVTQRQVLYAQQRMESHQFFQYIALHKITVHVFKIMDSSAISQEARFGVIFKILLIIALHMMVLLAINICLDGIIP